MIALVLLVAAGYSAFALWDNNQIYAEIENAQADLLKHKPEVGAGSANKVSFDELRAINPDVCAWVTMDGTKIDYPVVQGETNIYYLNTDVYGKFALAGSIFLDTRCSNAFNEPYALLYGHSMQNDTMFGALSHYKDAKFFGENTAGSLVTPDASFDLATIACVLVPSGDRTIFEPPSWSEGVAGLLDSVEGSAVQVNNATLEMTRSRGAGAQVLALSTCSYEYNGARTVLLCLMTPHQG